MVLFNILKDVPHTGLMYAITKPNLYQGRVTVTVGNARQDINTAPPEVTVLDNTPTYSRIKIETLFVMPSAFTLNAFEIGGYIQQGNTTTPIAVVRVEGLSMNLPFGSYYITAVISLQTPQNFDFFIR